MHRSILVLFLSSPWLLACGLLLDGQDMGGNEAESASLPTQTEDQNQLQPDAVIDLSAESYFTRFLPTCRQSLESGGALQETEPSFCETIPYLERAPRLDGVLEQGLRLARLPRRYWSPDPGQEERGPNKPAYFSVAWRSDGLYFFVLVDDPDYHLSENFYFHEGDSIEVYVDSDGEFRSPPSYDNPGTSQIVLKQIPSPESTIFVEAQYWRWKSVGDTFRGQREFPEARHVECGSGYAFELFVRRDSLDLNSWSLEVGNRVGLNLAVNHAYRSPDTGKVARAGQYFLQVTEPNQNDPASAYPFENAEAFCQPTLVGTL